jgi:hypothetical protein
MPVRMDPKVLGRKDVDRFIRLTQNIVDLVNMVMSDVDLLRNDSLLKKGLHHEDL